MNRKTKNLLLCNVLKNLYLEVNNFTSKFDQKFPRYFFFYSSILDSYSMNIKNVILYFLKMKLVEKKIENIRGKSKVSCVYHSSHFFPFQINSTTNFVVKFSEDIKKSFVHKNKIQRVEFASFSNREYENA